MGPPSPTTADVRPAVGDPFERELFEQASAEMRQEWFDRDTVAGFVVSNLPQTQEAEGLTVTVAPVHSEDQAWNSWPDGTARLFNDAVGYLWRVELHSDAPARWSPAHTQLAVNDTEIVFLPVAEPDELLAHLRDGAALETRVGATPNFYLRMRNADDFRRAYLGSDARTGASAGVVMFRAPTRRLQAVAMELTVGVWREGKGVRQFQFLFE